MPVVYCLVADSGHTYIGATVDLEHRLRQHRGELCGGARATSKRKGWKVHCHVENFPDWRSALQFEWRWKQISRKFAKELPPLARRESALGMLLELDTSTTAAIPYSAWPQPPNVVWG